MLQQIRDRSKGALAWVIVILISIPFALWGVHEYLGGGGSPAVATVNKTEITLQQFQRAYQQQRQSMQARFGRADFDEAALRRQTLEALVQDELMVQTADDWGLRVGDRQLADSIYGIGAFQRDGQFSPQLYEQQLRAIGTGPSGFEAQQRRALLADQLHSAIAASSIASRHDVERLIAIQEQERDIAYAVVPAERFLAGVSVSEEEIQRHYEANAQLYRHPEEVKVHYVELDPQTLAARVTLEEQELRRLYEEMAPALGDQERRRASHILIQVSEDGGPEAAAEARETAEELLASIEAGESFETLAREHSQDPGSAEQGGDLGFFERGMMVPAFEDAVFALEREGEITGPVQSQFGLHIIKLTGVDGGEKQTFEEARPQLEQELRARRADREYHDLAETLTYLTYEQPDSLIPAAETLDLEIQESEWFSRAGGEGIATDPQVVEAAFGEEVLGQGFNSEPIELGRNHLVVLRVEDHRPARPRELSEVRDDIVEELRHQAAQARAQELAESIRLALEGGATLEQAAAEHDLELTAPGMVGRAYREIDPEVMRAAFLMPRPQDGESSYRLVPLFTGDQALVAVHEVRDGDPAALEPERRASLERALADLYGLSEFDAVLSALRNEANIRVRDDRINTAN